MDKRILKYLNEKNTWANLGNLAAKYIEGVKDLKESMNKAYRIMKTKGVPEKEINDWVKTKRSLIENKEKSSEIIQDAYNCLDAHLSDALDLRRVIKKTLEKLDSEILEKGKFPTELMTQQKTTLNKIIKELKNINAESEEIAKKTNHSI